MGDVIAVTGAVPGQVPPAVRPTDTLTVLVLGEWTEQWTEQGVSAMESVVVFGYSTQLSANYQHSTWRGAPLAGELAETGWSFQRSIHPALDA